MTVGFDYWQVISHYPEEMADLMTALCYSGHMVYVISAIGKGRQGTITREVADKLPIRHGLFYTVEEVVFQHPRDSPRLKLEKCRELGIGMFFDDREDVCDLLNENGILAMRVPRKDDVNDLEGEQK